MVSPPRDGSRRTAPGETAADPLLACVLTAIRTHTRMDVAFVSEFSGGRRHFRHVQSGLGGPSGPLTVGHSDPLEHSLCARIADGSLPAAVGDAGKHPAVCAMDVVHRLRIGAHLGVPVRLSDGRLYGTLCCFSAAPNESLDDRDVGMMRAFADIVAEHIEKNLDDVRAGEESLARIERAMRPGALSMVFQPIYNLTHDRLDGFEALSRFGVEPHRPPDAWFAEAAAVGRQAELESLAIRQALAALDDLPDDVYVAVNASPTTIVEGHLARLLQRRALTRVMVEITEHEAVSHYGELAAALAPWRDKGLRLAIDDTGAGYASFRHILNLAPNIIKLDLSITRDVHLDATRYALARAVSGFAQATGIRLVAEGVESASEWQALRRLGFNKAQGHFLGRPMPLPDAVRLATGGGVKPSGLFRGALDAHPG